APLGSSALCRTESGPRGVGGRAASVELVQRRSALRYGRAGYLPGDGDVAAALVTFHLARIPGCLVNPNPILLLSASVRTAGVPLVQTSLLKSWNLRQLVPWLRGKVVAPPRSLSETKQCLILISQHERKRLVCPGFQSLSLCQKRSGIVGRCGRPRQPR